MKTKKNLAILTSNGLIGSGLSYFATVMLARELGPDQFGVYNYLFLLGSVATIFLNYSTDATAAVSLSRGETIVHVVSNIYGLRLIGFGVLVCVLLFVAMHDWVVALGVTVVSLPALNLAFLFELLGRNSTYSKIFLLERLLFAVSIIAVVAIPFVETSAVLAIIVLLACTLISLLAQVSLNFGIISKIRIEMDATIQILRENVFLVLVALATFSYGGLSRLALESNLGKEQLGLYSAGWQFVLLVTIFSGQVARIWRIRFAESISNTDFLKFTSTLKEYLMLATIPVCVVAFIFYMVADKIILLLFGQAYSATTLIMPWVCLYFVIVNMSSLATMLWTANGSRREYFLITMVWSCILLYILFMYSEEYSLVNYIFVVVLMHGLSVVTLLVRQLILLRSRFNNYL